jgi:hypothetical protein
MLVEDRQSSELKAGLLLGRSVVASPGADSAGLQRIATCRITRLEADHGALSS